MAGDLKAFVEVRDAWVSWGGRGRDGQYVSLEWVSWDPHAVSIEVEDPKAFEWPTWVLARSLLVEGGGEPDCQVRRESEHTCVTLRRCRGLDVHIEVRLPAAAVRRFVDLMLGHCPLGQEAPLEEWDSVSAESGVRCVCFTPWSPPRWSTARPGSASL